MYRKYLFLDMINVSLIFILIFHSNVSAQTTNIFSDPDLTKKFLDGKSYEVPGYGILKFNYNNIDTRKMKEVRTKDGADDELTDLTFDVSVKRNKIKRKDKTGYKIEMHIDSRDYESDEMDPTKLFAQSFYLLRNIIYPIKDFPSYYILFADGDLYFNQIKFKSISLNEYKSLILSSNTSAFTNFLNVSQSISTSKYIRCVPIN